MTACSNVRLGRVDQILTEDRFFHHRWRVAVTRSAEGGRRPGYGGCGWAGFGGVLVVAVAFGRRCCRTQVAIQMLTSSWCPYAGRVEVAVVTLLSTAHRSSPSLFRYTRLYGFCPGYSWRVGTSELPLKEQKGSHSERLLKVKCTGSETFWVVVVWCSWCFWQRYESHADRVWNDVEESTHLPA